MPSIERVSIGWERERTGREDAEDWAGTVDKFVFESGEVADDTGNGAGVG